MKDVNLLIGTPAYGNMLHIDYHNTIMGLSASGVQFDNMIVGNESLITRARNKILSYFYYNEKYTHLLFLDADIGLPLFAIPEMIKHKKDVIGLAVALKGLDAYGNPVLNTGEMLESKDGLIKVKKVGTAVFMLSRKAVESLVSISDSYKSSPLFTRGYKVYNDIYDIFKVGILDGEYLSEDYWVCNSLIKCGYDVLVDPTIPTKHNGNFEFIFRGNGERKYEWNSKKR